MKVRSLFFCALFTTSVIQPICAMDEQEAWNCEFFDFSKVLLRDLILSVRFKCNEDLPGHQLFKAIRDKNVTAVGTLLHEHPALLDAAADSDGVTPLLAATLTGQSQIVAHMLSREPRVDRCTHQGYTMIEINGKTTWLPIAGLTPLMAASKLNHIDIAKQLLGAGAQRELEDYGRPKKNAFAYAKEAGNIAMMDLVR